MKYIMFSRQYPKGHPCAGEPTFFPEKIINNRLQEFGLGGLVAYCNMDTVYPDLFDWGLVNEPSIDHLSKGHTIRPGRRWKKGEQFSPRVWSGLPYRSKQVAFLPPLTIVDVFDIKISYTGYGSSIVVWLGNNLLLMSPLQSSTGDSKYTRVSKFDLKIAQNDGLSANDWIAWFPNHFTGQMICWDAHAASEYRRITRRI